MPCPKCNHKIKYNYYNMENIGDFECMYCDYKSEKKPHVLVTSIDIKNKTFKANKQTYKVNYISPFYVYNYALTIALCDKLGIKDIQKSFSSFVNPANRMEEYKYHDKNIHYLRMKQENPETLQNALDIIASDKTKKAIWIGLYEIKDFYPAYTNTFYSFDCDFERIADNKVLRYTCFSKTVAYDIANRIIYAKINPKKIKVYDVEDDFNIIFEDLDKIKTNNIYIITGMKPYKKIKKYFEGDIDE